jgi:hypothetical protein
MSDSRMPVPVHQYVLRIERQWHQIDFEKH